MRIMIVGGRRKAWFLTKAFIQKKHKITLINKDADYCSKLSSDFEDAIVINGDGSKPFILEDANTQNMDIVIALASNDADNLVICQLCKNVFNVPRTMALVSSPQNVDIFSKLGVDTTVSSVALLTSIIEQRAFADDIKNFLSVGSGEVGIFEISVTEDSPICDKTLAEANIPSEATISCVIRNDVPIIPKGFTKILADDKLVVVAIAEEQEKVLEAILGGK